MIACQFIQIKKQSERIFFNCAISEILNPYRNTLFKFDHKIFSLILCIYRILGP